MTLPITILAVDPGIATTGFAVVRDGGGRRELTDVGVLTTPAEQPQPRRLATVHAGILGLLDRAGPDEAAIEQLFFANNTTSAMAVAEARGVILLAMEERGVPVREYTPIQVKSSLTGYGKATKAQMMRMVRANFDIPDKLPDDAFDAVAIALCHLQSRRLP